MKQITQEELLRLNTEGRVQELRQEYETTYINEWPEHRTVAKYAKVNDEWLLVVSPALGIEPASSQRSEEI